MRPAPPLVHYADGVTRVELGDHVQTRDFLRLKVGRVIYIPGQSPPHSEMEHHGFAFVGVQVPRGVFLLRSVDLDTRRLTSKVTFLRRDTENVEELAQDARLE